MNPPADSNARIPLGVPSLTGEIPEITSSNPALQVIDMFSPMTINSHIDD